MNINSKKASHVGMIISFVIFITFIVFLYVVVNPVVSIGENKKTTLDYIGSRIEENISTNLTSAAVKIVSLKNPNKDCIQFVGLLAFLGVSPPYPLIVKNETGGIQEAYSVGAGSADLVVDRKKTNSLFFQVYISPEFPPIVINPLSSCGSTQNYNISLVKTSRYVYEKNVYELISYYQTNYEKLKDEFNIAPGDEFGFGFTWSNGTKVEIGNASKSVDIFAKEVPVQYVDDKANILSGFINVKVW